MVIRALANAVETRARLRLLNVAVRALLVPVERMTRGRVPRNVRGRPARVLVVKLVGLGDAVMIRQALDALGEATAGCEVEVLSGPATGEALCLGAQVVEHRYDPAGRDRGLVKLLGLVRRLRKRKFDAVIDFEHHIVLVSIVLWLAGIRDRVGLAGPGNPRRLFQTITVPLTGEDRMWEAYGTLLELAFGARPAVGLIAPRYSEGALEAADRLLGRKSATDVERSVIALHVGSGGRGAARRWPVGRFVELAERLREEGIATKVLLTGTPLERELVEEFKKGYRGECLDGTSLGSLEATAAALAGCRLAVSNDTGVMHLAAALGVPTVGLFGPNLPSRYGPVGPWTASVYRTKEACSPCINIHLGQVPECTHEELGRCLLDISVEDVLGTARGLLAEAEGGERRG